MRDFVKGALKLIGVIAAIGAIVLAVLYFFFVRIVEVGHNAMAPTIFLGDRVVVWRTTDLEVGDIVLCPHPTEPGRFVMARYLSRPGHTVEVSNGQVRVDGDSPDADVHTPILWHDTETGREVSMVWGTESILDHDHLFFFRERGAPSYRRREVGPGMFVLTDNRSYLGEDSRAFGVLSQIQCIGKVFMRLTAGDGVPPEIPHGALDLLE
ncbi:MAG: signal peptidase I [Sandaracinaceae bacterium]